MGNRSSAANGTSFQIVEIAILAKKMYVTILKDDSGNVPSISGNCSLVVEDEKRGTIK